jgi:thymidylate synthase
MRQYLHLLRDVLNYGEEREDRTGTGTISLFGPQMRFDLQKGFPLVTTKKTWFRGIVEELLWFLRGDTNVNDLPESVQKIWDKWADEDGSLGPIYGNQLRAFKRVKPESHVEKFDGQDPLAGNVFCGTYTGAALQNIDQIARTIYNIREYPDSRRHVMTTWSPGDLEDMNLAPCHGVAIQFYVRSGEYLDCKMYQRSADLFIGVPFNIASYSLLTHLMARLTGYKAGQFVHSFGDAHIYQNHIDQVKEQLSREPKEKPEVEIDCEWLNEDEPIKDLYYRDYDEEDRGWSRLTYENFKLKNYNHHPHISAPIAV